MMKMDPSFIEQAQRRHKLIFRDCRAYMRKHNWTAWTHGCHFSPCEAAAYGLGVDKCEQRANELKFLDTLLKGSGTRTKPGKRQYQPWTRRIRAPRVRIVKP